MSGSNCCFLTGIHISQEAGKLVWCSHLLRNFPQFVVIHTVKGFSVVNEAEVAVFLEFSCFFYDSADVGNWVSGSSAFLNPAWTSGSSRFTHCRLIAWRILSITLLVCIKPNLPASGGGRDDKTGVIKRSWWSHGGGIKMLTVLFFQLFCRFEIFHSDV